MYYMKKYRVIVKEATSGKRIIIKEDGYKECVLCLKEIVSKVDTEFECEHSLVEIISEDNVLQYRFVWDKENGKYFVPVRFIGELTMQADYGRSGFKKLYETLNENRSSLTLTCTDRNGERITTGSGVFDWVSKTIVKAENTNFKTIDNMIDALLLALPAGIYESIHSLDLRINDDGLFTKRPVYFWSKAYGSEFDIIIANHLEGVSYEL